MTFRDFVFSMLDFANFVLVPLVFAIALVCFLWGIVRYFFIGGGADAAKQEAARGFLLWGLLAMALLFSVWGLVNMVLRTFFRV